MNIVLCHPFDQDAIWLCLELRKAGAEIELLAPEQVLMAREWTQELDSDSDEFVLSIPDGLSIRSGDIEFLFNRTQFVDAPVWRHADEREREYVRSEMTAMMISWLYQVQQRCLMLNPPVGYSLCGAAWTDAQWTMTAFDAGFKEVVITKDRTATDDKVLVFNDEILSGLEDKELKWRCLNLASSAQSPLLEITVRNEGNMFTGATPFPALRAYGQPFLDMVQRRLLGDRQ